MKKEQEDEGSGKRRVKLGAEWQEDEGEWQEDEGEWQEDEGEWQEDEGSDRSRLRECDRRET